MQLAHSGVVVVVSSWGVRGVQLRIPGARVRRVVLGPGGVESPQAIATVLEELVHESKPCNHRKESGEEGDDLEEKERRRAAAGPSETIEA